MTDTLLYIGAGLDFAFPLFPINILMDATTPSNKNTPHLFECVETLVEACMGRNLKLTKSDGVWEWQGRVILKYYYGFEYFEHKENLPKECQTATILYMSGYWPRNVIVLLPKLKRIVGSELLIDEYSKVCEVDSDKYEVIRVGNKSKGIGHTWDNVKLDGVVFPMSCEREKRLWTVRCTVSSLARKI